MSHFDTLIGAELSHQPITFTSKVSIFPEDSASLLGMLGGHVKQLSLRLT